MAVRDIFKFSFKTFVNPAAWVGYDSLQEHTQEIWTVLKNLFQRPEPPAHEETFEAALARFGLSEAEAAALGKPLVAFEEAGGIREFIERDCGCLVPYLDIQKMAEKILELFDSPFLLEQQGKSAAKKVRKRHDLLKAAPRILHQIKQLY